jgi:hypothetical protein
MAMKGVDPCACMQQVAVRMNKITSRNEDETVLDELEYMLEVIFPDIQAYDEISFPCCEKTRQRLLLKSH